MSETRLWAVDHPYYCETSNYYAPGDRQPYAAYRSWGEFHAEQGTDDLDMNLVFRWDWTPKEYVEDDAERAAFDARHDDNYRAYTLSLFYMGQRKGLFRVAEVDVCRGDEPAVREWLTTRWEHLQLLWEPFADVPAEVSS